jgi:predicted phage terminase large subunit-like protein
VRSFTMAIRRELWLEKARLSQWTPEGNWHTWLVLAGRGFGKTRTAAEDVAWYGWTHSNSRIAVIAETFADGRDVCIEGESGLLSVLPAEDIKNWNRSLGELVLTNGTIYRLFSGDKPDGARGYQFHRAWFDELAKYRYAREAWTQIQLGLRLGDDPRSIVTTTPQPVAIIKELMGLSSTHVTRGSTFDNIANLAAPFITEVRARYEGTRIGRQELYGEYLDDVPGALWTRDMVDEAHITEAPELARVVVAIDPAMTSGEDADETGIVVAGKGVDGRAYVLSDATCRLTPDGWARRAVEAYHTFKADRIVAEVNNGGEMVQYTLRTVGGNVPYKKLHASRGKRVRAEPIAALYEQGRVSHVGSFPELEDQMCTFVPDEVSFSPDRVDALVWALTELMLNQPKAKVHVFDSWS